MIIYTVRKEHSESLISIRNGNQQQSNTLNIYWLYTTNWLENIRKVSPP